MDEQALVPALLMQGTALQEQARYIEALALFERATQLAPDSFDAWANLGYILNELGRFEEALAADDQALVLDPNSVDTWVRKVRHSAILALPGGIGCLRPSAHSRPKRRNGMV